MNNSADDHTLQWHVVYTHANRETMAEQHLLQQNFSVYLPRYKKIRRHARKAIEVVAPLFPRYLFVSLNAEINQWRVINNTRGVTHLLTINNRPAVVPCSIIESLKSEEIEEGIVPVNSVLIFNPGETVRICDGLFEGQTAVVEKMDDHYRVHVLLNFLGRETTVHLPCYSVERII